MTGLLRHVFDFAQASNTPYRFAFPAAQCWWSTTSSLSFPETIRSPMAAAATPRTASKWEYDCPSPIRFPFGLTTYYSRLTCLVAGTQMKLLVSRSPLGFHAEPRRSARNRRAAHHLAKFRIQKGHEMWLEVHDVLGILYGLEHEGRSTLIYCAHPPSRGSHSPAVCRCRRSVCV